MHIEQFTWMQTCLGTGDLLLRMCGKWENFVVHLRISRALSGPFLSSIVTSIGSHRVRANRVNRVLSPA